MKKKAAYGRIIPEKAAVYRVVASQLIKVAFATVIPQREKQKREVCDMETYEILSLLFLGGSFLVTLLAYIDRINKRK